MNSESDRLRTIADVVALLERHGINVSTTRGCRTSHDDECVRARLDVDVPLDVDLDDGVSDSLYPDEGLPVDEDETGESGSKNGERSGEAAAQDFRERIDAATADQEGDEPASAVDDELDSSEDEESEQCDVDDIERGESA